MNFILKLLSPLIGKLFGSKQKTENNENVNVLTQNNTAISDARASVIFLCVICLAISWIIQYVVADFFWIRGCIAHNGLVPFPLKDEKLFHLIYAMVGLGGVGFVHKLIK